MTSPVLPGPAGHSWAPWSPCDLPCLPRPVGLSPAARVVVAVRLAGVGVLLAVGTVLAVAAPLLGPRGVGALQRRWSLALLTVAGVRVQADGAEGCSGVVPAGALVVANHVSWLDVLVLTALAPVRLLAKREVRTWPLVGAMARRVGTVFLDRQRLRALPAAVAAVADVLRTGGVVAVFPEGTTRCGRSRDRFRPASFQAAVDAGAPVVPVALSYVDAAGRATAVAAFIGEDTLWASLRRVVAAGPTTVRADILPAQRPLAVPAGPGRAFRRRELAERVAGVVERALARDSGAVSAGSPPDGLSRDAVEVSRAA